jgi:hypothetical protein
MSKDTPRKRNIRIIKEQWIPKLELQQAQIMNILPEYAEGSDSNMIIAAKLQALHELCEVHKQAIGILLEGL